MTVAASISMREMLEMQMGKSAPTYQNRLEGVLKARSQLADRIEVKSMAAAKGHQPSLRESLSDSYDLKSVDAASQDLGLGSPVADAEATVSEEAAHLDPDFDVTKDL